MIGEGGKLIGKLNGVDKIGSLEGQDKKIT